jgi:hypothetical protein
MTILVFEHDSVERAATRIAGTDPNREPRDMRLCPCRPAESVRGQFTPRTDELAKGAAIHANDLGDGHLNEPTLQNLDIHRANLAEPRRHIRLGRASCDTVGGHERTSGLGTGRASPRPI